MQIYVTQNGQRLGPFTEEELKAQVVAGKISAQDLVWWEGQANWVKLDQTPFAADIVPSAPPVVSAAVMPAPGGVMPAGPVERTSGMAIGSLVCGIAALFVGITFIVAIILGHMSLSEIKRTPGLKGRGMAIAGLVLGYAYPAVLAVISVIAISVLLALGQTVKDTFKTINAQLAEAQAADTNSTENPATNNVPDTNSAPESSNAPATNTVPDTNSAPATSSSSTTSSAPSTNSAPDASNSSSASTTNAAPSSGGH